MRIRPLLVASLILLAVGGAVGSLALRTDSDAAAPARSAPSVGAPARATAASPEAVDPAQRRADVAARTGRRQYRSEVRGTVERNVAARVAQNPALLAAVRRGDLATARAIAGGLLYRADHVSHIEVVRATKPLVTVGKPFVVAATPIPLPGPGGAPVATLHASIQDVIGFVRLLHRRTQADVIVRGRGGRLETSLPAATRVTLPKHGPVTVAGRRYHVAYFRERGLLGEPLRVWVLTRG